MPQNGQNSIMFRKFSYYGRYNSYARSPSDFPLAPSLHPKKWLLVRNPVLLFGLLCLYYVLGLRTLRFNQDRVFLDGAHLPQSEDKMYLFQEHSALENIEYILSLDRRKCTPSFSHSVQVCLWNTLLTSFKNH